MQKLVWQNANGVELDLTSGNYGITEWEGFSNASLNIQSQQVPFQDGGVFLDALIEQRELSVTLAMQDNNNLELRYQQRRELISALNPKLGEGYLIYTNDFISKRIKCIPQIPLFENHNSNDTGTPKASLSWIACSPYWEDLEETEVDFNYGEVLKVDNKGDVKTQVKAELFTRDVEDPTIINMTTNQKIKIQGEVNNNIIINTNNGEKRVREETINFNISQDDSYIGKFCYSKKLGMYLATGGYIRISYDGKEWETLYNTLSTGGIAYSEDKGIFVALAGQQYYYTSTDGILWVKRNTPTSTYGEYRAVIYIEEEGKFYIANHYYLYESTDGINWQEIANLNLNLPTVFYYDEKNSLFLIGDYNGKITKTTDFENWETITVTSTSIHDIIYDGSKYFCFSTNIVSSSDLENWEDVTPAIPEGYVSMSITCAAYNDVISKYIASALLYTGVTSEQIELNSNDGETWEIMFDNKNRILCNIFVKTTGITLQGSEKGDIYLSLDLSEWKNEIEKDINGSLSYISFSEDKKVFIGISSNDIYISYDGIKWFLENSERPDIGNFRNLCYLEKTGQFLIDGNNGSIISSDGKNWKKNEYHSYSTNLRYKTIYARKLGLYFQIDTASNGGLFRSEDGVVYEKVYNVNNQSDVYIKDVAYSEEQNILVIVGNNRVCISSDGGNTWVEDLSEKGTSIAYSKNEDMFVKINETTNNTSIIKTSKDGSVWEEQFEFQQGVPVRSLAYSDSLNLFFAPELFNNHKILLSSNGKDWKEEELPFLGYFNEFAYGGCVVVSNIQKTFVFSNFTPYSFCLYYTTLKEGDNKISKLSSDSDMTFYLKTGINKIRMQKEDGSVSCRLTYRQKYIGV